MDNTDLEFLAKSATEELNQLFGSKVDKNKNLKKLREAAEKASQKKKKTQPEASIKPRETSDKFDIKELLQVMVTHEASDLHLKEGSPPMVRIHGDLYPVGDESLTARETREMVFDICKPSQKIILDNGREVDFAYSYREGRFRINAYWQKSTLSASVRMIKEKIPTFESLNLPSSIKNLMAHKHGLVLVTGPTGSGKSTTLAAMINYLNENKAIHIVSIEDPIEYIHTHKRALITQREVGADTLSFKMALKYSLRQDPNVILIGEMRDPETIMIAAQAAETGHFVLSTLHTPNTVQAITRVTDVFDEDSQKQIRLLLASNLRGIVSQRLLSRVDGKGRVPIVEIMINTPTIASLILEGEVNEIYKYINEGATLGMQTMNQSLYYSYKEGLISYEDALANSDHPTELRMSLEGYISSSDVFKTGEDGSLMSWL
ncbi:MAG: type IV pilus twitching motility protein PilT [Vulcanimicrobiota bacterium]